MNVISGLGKSKIHWADNLIRNMSIPSVVHSYSLAIEYMKDRWFLPKFGDGFFKTVYVNGKYIFDDQRRFNQIKTRQIQKPAVAIIPNVDSDWDRDNLDLYTGGLAVYTAKDRRFDNRIIRDDENNIHLAMEMKQLQMPFEFHIRVARKAEQLNLISKIKMACRIGSTQGEYIEMDWLLPKDIILAIAIDAGFRLKQLKDKEGNVIAEEVKDTQAFVKYLNSVSIFPITYKFRGISGSLEYFIRVPGLYVHIACLDGISKDDGERQGQLDNNFHIDFTATLQMPMPSLLVYYSEKEHSIKQTDDSSIGLYQFTVVGPPKRNARGWSKYIESDYIADDLHLDTINLHDLFDTISDEDDVKRSIFKVLDDTISMGLSPSMFIEIQMYNGQHPLHPYVDWEKFEISINADIKQYVSKVAIYVDLGYINTSISNIEKLNEAGRIG